MGCPAHLDYGRVLVASSNEKLRQGVSASLARKGKKAVQAVGGADALMALERASYDAVLIERWLPDLEVPELVRCIQQQVPGLPVVLLDDRGRTVDHGDTAPYQYLLPVDEAISSATPELTEHSAADVAEGVELLPSVIGRSDAIRKMADMVRLVAQRNTTVLLTGQSGCGKDLFAQAVHRLSRRADQPFVVVNCAAIPETLLESELFGYTKGAFTGALQARLGRIHAAHGGTLFLDEIGELPLSMQAKLLRFVQEREVQRLGSADVFRVDVRIVAATNADLPQMVKEKRFREDLFYRLCVFPVRLAPLAERRDDILPLAAHFLGVYCREHEVAPKVLSTGATSRLLQHEWPGNVRELQHVVERAVIFSQDEKVVGAEHIHTTALPS